MDVPNIGAAPAGARTVLVPLIHTYAIGRRQNVFLGKSDIKVNDRNQLVFRFNHQGFNGKNNENNGPLSAEEHSGDSNVKSDTFSSTLTSTLTQRIVNEFRFQYARDREPGLANSASPEAVIGTAVTGSAGTNLSIGRNNFSPRYTNARTIQWAESLAIVRGRHTFKTGLDMNFQHIDNFFPGNFSGSYTFNSYADFASNRPFSFTQAFAGAGTDGPLCLRSRSGAGLVVRAAHLSRHAERAGRVQRPHARW